MFRLDGKVAIVTGASGTLGRAICVSLATAGAASGEGHVGYANGYANGANGHAAGDGQVASEPQQEPKPL